MIPKNAKPNASSFSSTNQSLKTLPPIQRFILNSLNIELLFRNTYSHTHKLLLPLCKLRLLRKSVAWGVKKYAKTNYFYQTKKQNKRISNPFGKHT